MELFIRIVDGQPFEHPIFGDNFRQAFPDVDVDNLPAGFARFERVEKPVIGPYALYEGVTYEQKAGVYTDVHHIRAMTAEEKQAKIEKTLSEEHPKGWVFDEERCAWIPSSANINLPGSTPDVIG